MRLLLPVLLILFSHSVPATEDSASKEDLPAVPGHWDAEQWEAGSGDAFWGDSNQCEATGPESREKSPDAASTSPSGPTERSGRADKHFSGPTEK